MSIATWAADAGFLARREQALNEARRRGGRRGVVSALFRRHLSRVTAWGQVRALSPHLLLLIVAWNLPPAELRAEWSTLIVLAIVMTHVVPHGERLLAADEFERIHAPSYAGLVLYRWLWVVPGHLAIGGCWAGVLWTVQPSWSVAAMGLLAPLYLTTQKLWSLVRLDLKVLTSTSMLRNLCAMVVLPLPALGILLFGSLRGDLGWFAGGNETGALMLTGWFLLGTPWLLGSLLRQPQPPAEGERPTDPRISVTAAEAALPTRHAGRRSLWASGWFGPMRVLRAYRKLGIGWVIACATVLGWLLASSLLAGAAVIYTPGSPYLPLLAILFVVPWSRLAEDEALYGFGVDLSEIERHNLLGRIVGVALPVAVALVAMVVFPAGGGAARQSLAWILGLGLLRLGWRGLFLGIGGWKAFLVFVLLVAVVCGAVGGGPDLAWGATLLAGASGIVGAARIWFTTEATWRAWFRAAAE